MTISWIGLQLNNLELATIYADKALKHFPEDCLIITNRGLIALKSKDYESAKTFLNKAIDVNPDCVIAREELDKIID